MSHYRRKGPHGGRRPRWSDDDRPLLEQLAGWAEGLVDEPKRAFHIGGILLAILLVTVVGLWLLGHLHARPGEPTLGDELRTFAGNLHKTVDQADYCEKVSAEARRATGEVGRRQEELLARLRGLHRWGDERLGTGPMADTPEGRLWARIRRFQGLDPELLRVTEERLAPAKRESPEAIRLRAVRAENVTQFAALKLREIVYLNHRLKRLEATALKGP